MIYERPLPEGMTEPDPAAVEVEAVLQLVLLLFNSWPDDRIMAEVGVLRTLQVGSMGGHIAEADVLDARGAERAAQILSNVMSIRQDLEMIRNPIDS